MAEALSGHVKVKHLRVYPLTVERVAASVFCRDSLQLDLLDNITRYYRLKKTLEHPNLDTPRWRAHLWRRATQWYYLFRRKLAGADLLVVWNGFSIPLGAAVAAARSLGMKMLFCENGVLPGTLAMDPQGINYANSIAGKPGQFYQSIAVEPKEAKDLFEITPQQRPLRKVAGHVSTRCDDDKPLPDHYVLFAMQVHDDTQVLLFSPRFPSIAAAVSYVWERVAAYNARTGDTLQLVVKEHPSDFGRVDYSALRASLPGSYFLRSTPVSKIIPDAEAVITLNSAVGVEGLLYLRPVITLGDAFYNVPGMVHHVGAQDDLAGVLAETIGRPVNVELITKFLYFLRYDYLVSVSRHARDVASFEPAVKRILQTLDDKLYWVPRSSNGC